MIPNIQRIIKRIEEIYKCGLQDDGTHTRMAFSKELKMGREKFSQYFRNLNIKTREDSAGNLIARMEGRKSEAKSILIISHLDTVIDGGKYDGALGCVLGLEVMNVLKENNITLNHPLEVIDFSDEEGVRFGSGLIGSSAFTGVDLDISEDDKDFEGRTRREIFEEAGISFNKISDSKRDKDSVLGILELHIEQGATLDIEKVPIGIVSTIAGVRRYEIEIFGEANHSGSTIMELRNDALVKSSKFISELPQMVKEIGGKFTVATVGTMKVFPNAVNVIPGRCIFNLEIRDQDLEVIDRIERRSIELLEKICGKNKKSFNISKILDHLPRPMNREIMESIEESVKKRNYSYSFTPSGAFHDSLVLSEEFKVGMIFVPSVAGISHSSDEYTRPEDIEKGFNVLLDTILRLDGE